VGPRAGLDVCEKSHPHWDYGLDSLHIALSKWKLFPLSAM
jgi:hypothetical protein